MYVAVAVAVFLAGVSIARAAASPQKQTVVNDASQTVSVDCGEGGDVVINGGHNRVTVTGGCAKVTVASDDNTIAIDAVDKIMLNGANNKVTYKRAWKGKAPKVEKVGANNQVTQR